MLLWTPIMGHDTPEIRSDRPIFFTFRVSLAVFLM
jgi:hypothetical protein